MTRITIADVAKAAGLGLSTVDRVINGRRPVRAETAKRVLDAAERIGFYGASMIRERVSQRPGAVSLDFVLLRRSTSFYRMLGDALVQEARSRDDLPVRVNIHFLDDFTPRGMLAQLQALIGKTDGVAVVSADHPLVSQCIADLARQGIPTISFISDLTAPQRKGYVGLDFWRLGRTAGWAVARLSASPGKVGVVIGSHRYLSQEAMEMGFRSYFREKTQGFEILEPVSSLEDASLACEATLHLLARHPDLRGLYVAGGGIEGVIDALRDTVLPEGFVTVCPALTEVTRAALQSDLIQVVLSHPYKLLAQSAIDMLQGLVGRPADQGLLQALVPFQVITSENL
jgi:LacI family transcriptional regulator